MINKTDYVTNAINVLGDTSLVICMEECSELTKELSKHIRGKGNYDNTCEEIADVLLTIEWAIEKLNLNQKDIEYWKNKKKARIVELISKGELR
ncbi:MAG: hypothetical protein ACRC7S_18965 [Cetobacterium sp.]